MSARIIVGIAPTPAGNRALEWAAQRATDRGASLLLVAVVAGAMGAVGEGTVLENALRTAGDDLEARAATVRKTGLIVDIEVRRGDPAPELIATSADASLLVIGSDYRGREHGPARGVTGIRIVAGASCPVVVVPDLDTSGRSGVVVGADGSPISEAAIAFAAAEADRLKEPLVAVAVWTPLEHRRDAVVYGGEYLAGMQAQTEELLALSLAGLRQDYPDLEIVQRVERGYPSEVINELASSARLTVVGSHGRGRIARFLLGSISHEVLSTLATVTAVVR